MLLRCVRAMHVFNDSRLQSNVVHDRMQRTWGYLEKRQSTASDVSLIETWRANRIRHHTIRLKSLLGYCHALLNYYSFRCSRSHLHSKRQSPIRLARACRSRCPSYAIIWPLVFFLPVDRSKKRGLRHSVEWYEDSMECTIEG